MKGKVRIATIKWNWFLRRSASFEVELGGGEHMQLLECKPQLRAVAALVGCIVGAGLMGGVGYTHRTSVATGAFAGAVLLGMLCHGVAAGTMSAATLCAVLFGLFFAMVGPGYDDYSGIMVIPMALFGAIIGWLFFGRRRSQGPLGSLDRRPAD
ncbi:hypothetical protein [Paludisphaera borealis]|uniref:Uncharacterized protein n=1 Tax=Paludisphaera borealis TaxID=1387353 RepID=A0A1U7CRS3_9BACT|nr:hypothetical protein [Paludisphaera borealis]APW61632.1 hypothetical protein BSF38_03157 [Paludisphaera borealis]